MVTDGLPTMAELVVGNDVTLLATLLGRQGHHRWQLGFAPPSLTPAVAPGTIRDRSSSGLLPAPPPNTPALCVAARPW